jgi:hypothetical protein
LKIPGGLRLLSKNPPFLKPGSCDKSNVSAASDIKTLALKLPERSRLKLAGELLRSMPATATSDEALAEARKREAELDSGKVLPLSEVDFWKGTRRPSYPA